MVRFDHVAISSSNIQETIKFYCEYLEMGRKQEWAGQIGDKIGYEFFSGGEGGLILEVNWSEGGETKTSLAYPDHICFVVDDINGMLQRAEVMGYRYGEPDCNGNVVVFDPDGNAIELACVPE